MPKGPAEVDGRDAADVSRDQVDWFLKKRRANQQAQLTTEIGAERLGKLHPWIVNQILDEREEAKFAQWTGAPAPAATDPAHEVLINLESGKATGRVSAPKSRRREAVTSREREADSALGGLRDDLRRRGIEVEAEFWLTHSAQATLTSDEVIAIAARPDVSTVSTNKEQFALHLDVSRPLIRANNLPGGLTGAGIDVAIVDTGVDAAHAGFAGVTVSAQQDMTGTAVQRDDKGHGTHCAGIVASQDATFHGIAPGVDITDIRVMNGLGRMRASWGVAGFTACVTAGVDVASNSWGFSHKDGNWVDSNGTCVLCTAADNAVALGIVVVVSAGNSGDDICGSYDTIIGCPGNAHNIITVGATDDTDNLASFSSTGQTPDGRLKPEVAAPGVDIASLQAAGTSLGPVVAPGIVNSSGTSMAAPHIAAVAALILEKNGNLSPADVRTLIMNNGVDIPNLPLLWFDRIDALAAVNATPTPP
jgi:serine protease AprX